MFDTDKFIEYVRESPALWDRTCEGYKDKTTRDRSWVAVGELFYHDWNSTSCKRKSERVKEMKKKWRHIRDHFFRILNKGKSGDSVHSRHKKYMYADSLSFLLNWESGRPTSESVASQEETEEERFGEFTIGMEDSEETEETGHDGMIATPDAENPTAMNHSLQHQLLKYLESVPKVEEEDADRMFILSMLPNFKALTESQKLDFKIMSLQFFKNAKIGQ